MSDFEIVLCCVLIPFAFVLTYIAGKNDLVAAIGELIREKAEELNARKADYSTVRRDNSELLQKADEQGYLSGFDFAILMQRFLISKDGYVIDTGNWENVNAEVALRLARRIEEHPLLWEMFMVA